MPTWAILMLHQGFHTFSLPCGRYCTGSSNKPGTVCLRFLTISTGLMEFGYIWSRISVPTGFLQCGKSVSLEALTEPHAGNYLTSLTSLYS